MNLCTTLPELFLQYTISHDSQLNNKCTCIIIMHNSFESVSQLHQTHVMFEDLILVIRKLLN